MKTKFTLLGGAALLAFASMGVASPVEAKETWGKGAPEFSDPDGNIKFKVRGRIMMDAVNVEQDMGGTSNDLDVFQTRLRRARLGVEGQLDSKWKYKAEVTLTGRGSANVEWEDAFLEYRAGFGSLVLGHQKIGSPLEEATSSRFVAHMERSMMTEAFGFGRVMGVGAIFGGETNWQLTTFLNGDSLNNADILNNGTVDEQTSILVHGHWAPLAEKQKMVHLGGTVRFRDGGNDAAGTLRARARAGSNVFSTRQVDVGSANQFVEDTFYGVEAATIMGPFWASAEYGALKGDGVTAATDADFTSYNLQAGWFLTGESRGYKAKSGEFDRTTPLAPVSEGGMGAWELRARYDYIDLDDGAIDGGEATSYTVGVNWSPAKNIRFMGEYVTTEIEERTALTNNGDVDVIQFRAMFDF
jgi:phosphate-selective porin OprO and OprP